jgi:arsenate reductase (thioredoxin)
VQHRGNQVYLIDWGIEDPKGKPIEQVREIRDDIKQRVKQLVTNLPKDN